MRYLAVFAAVVLLDAVFALYIVETAARNALAASVWAGLIQVCNAVTVVSLAKDWRMVVPAVLGAFVGTWIVLA